MAEKEIDWAGRTLKIETGKLARQADAGVLVRYGDTVVLTTVVYSKEKKEDVDFLPLTVNYRELAFAAGKIPGGFFKREGRPRDKEILSSRLIDRPIRPLFPDLFFHEMQIISFLLSSDLENEGDILGIIGASTALTISEMPFFGPIGAVRIGRIDGEFIINPTVSQLDNSTLNLVVCGNEESIFMLEGGAREVKEEIIAQALERAQEEIGRLVVVQKELKEAVGKPKMEIIEEGIPKEMEEEIRGIATQRVIEVNNLTDKETRREGFKKLLEDLTIQLEEKYSDKLNYISLTLEKIIREDVRARIIKEGKRLDGRRPEDLRPISCEIGVLPRTHGSALFTRGQTQCLAVATLGTKSDEQFVDNIEREESKSFMLHYNFPPFSTGEVGPMRAPSRREIGHGALAEKAIQPVLPVEERFPYTIRVVSNILESNGSSSMATVCGASLSLMDAGVPVKTAVAGISMGLVKEKEKSVLLTDILGDEDHYGDMDFKIAGTREGVTAIQLDLKAKGVSIRLLKEAMERSRDVRMEILDIMSKTIDKPKSTISQYAPRIITFTVPKEKIGEIIGPGGKVIRRIIEETGAQIDIDDSGKVVIATPSGDALKKAELQIKGIIADAEIGKVYLGKVKRINSFGAFVEILPGKEGLLRISEIAPYRIKNIRDVLKVGDKIMVKVIDIDPLGRINLSKRRVLETDKQKEYHRK